MTATATSAVETGPQSPGHGQPRIQAVPATFIRNLLSEDKDVPAAQPMDVGASCTERTAAQEPGTSATAAQRAVPEAPGAAPLVPGQDTSVIGEAAAPGRARSAASRNTPVAGGKKVARASQADASVETSHGTIAADPSTGLQAPQLPLQSAQLPMQTVCLAPAPADLSAPGTILIGKVQAGCTAAARTPGSLNEVAVKTGGQRSGTPASLEPALQADRPATVPAHAPETVAGHAGTGTLQYRLEAAPLPPNLQLPAALGLHDGLRTPASPHQVLSAGTLREAALPGTAMISAANADAFPVSTLAASANVLEVGVASGAHGWLRVRAERTAGGEVSTAMLATSVGAASGLERELPALTAYLDAHLDRSLGAHAVAPTIHVESPASRAGTGPGDRSASSAQDPPRQAAPASRGESLFTPEPSRSALPAIFPARTDGGWLSVRV